jgi:hypothetical protein
MLHKGSGGDGLPLFDLDAAPTFSLQCGLNSKATQLQKNSTPLLLFKASQAYNLGVRKIKRK